MVMVKQDKKWLIRALQNTVTNIPPMPEQSWKGARSAATTQVA
jgi:hypothetical protein